MGTNLPMAQVRVRQLTKGEIERHCNPKRKHKNKSDNTDGSRQKVKLIEISDDDF